MRYGSLQEEYEEYSEKAKTLPQRTTNENKLILYGLYKQATVGNVNTDRPGIFYQKDRVLHAAAAVLGAVHHVLRRRRRRRLVDFRCAAGCVRALPKSLFRWESLGIWILLSSHLSACFFQGSLCFLPFRNKYMIMSEASDDLGGKSDCQVYWRFLLIFVFRD